MSIHKKFKCNHYLLVLAIVHDLERTPLGNIYDSSIAILFGTVFFSAFWRLWKLVVWGDSFQNLIFMFYFHPKAVGIVLEKLM